MTENTTALFKVAPAASGAGGDDDENEDVVSYDRLTIKNVPFSHIAEE